MKHLLQSVSQGAADDEASEDDAFTSVNGTFALVNDNFRLDIINGLYYYEVNSAKMMQSSLYRGLK